MKNLAFLFALLFFFGCSKDNDENNDQPLGGVKEISVNIELPENSNISSESLSVSSFLTEGSQGSIMVFDDESIELAMANNNQGNTVLLCYYNPADGNEILMNSETTAIALIMLHQWTFDLSVNGKKEAIEYIKNLAEFQSYKQIVENSIQSGELDPLVTPEIFNKVTEIQNIVFQSRNDFIEPLLFTINNSTATVKNVLSSASYSVGLYNEFNSQTGDTKLASGLPKSQYLMQEFQSGTFQGTENSNQSVSFDIPSDGSWILKAKSGLSFDGSPENQEAAIDNSGKLALNILGLFSTKLKDLLGNGECLYNVGNFIWNGTSSTIDISEKFQDYSNGTITGYQLSRIIITYIFNRSEGMIDVIGSCVDNPEYYGLNIVNVPFFKRVLSFVNILGNLQNAYDGSAMLTDWLYYDKDIEYCFSKTGNETSRCYQGLFADAAIIKSFLEVNGIDVSDSKWDSQDINDIVEILTVYGSAPSSQTGSFLDARVRQIFMYGGGIHTVPDIIENLSELTQIFLSNPPPPFDNDVVNNSITSIPESIGNLTKLQELEIAYNNIASIPESIGNLDELNRITLNNNNLTTIPNSMGNCTNLTNLNLDENSIINVPNSFANLTELRYCFLRKNQINNFPSIPNFTELIALYLDNNNLTSVPLSIGSLINLSSLDITYNPNLKCLPQEIWNSPSINAAASGQYFYSGTGISNQNDTDCSN